MGTLSLYQLDNAGFAIKTPEGLWLVDALHEGAKQYGGTSQAALALIRRLAEGIKEPVRLLLTHLHQDHATAGAIRAFADSAPLLVYGADPALQGWDLGKAGLHLLPLEKEAAIGRDRLFSLPLPHLNPQQFNILHTVLCLNIQGKTLFVSGDGMMDERIYQRHQDRIRGVDAAVCLYSYAFTRRNLAFVKEHIAPGTLVVNHFPEAARDEFDSLNRFRAFVEKAGEGLSILPFARVGDKLDV